MKPFNMVLFLILAVFLMAGCSDGNSETANNENADSADEKKEEQESTGFEPGNFEPGNFKPGNFEPGNFEPGNFEPGNFEPGNFKPGTFTPGNFDRDVTVSVEEEEIVVEVPSHLLFDFDKSELKSDVIETLDQLSEDLNQYDGAYVMINGHTDSQGKEDYNQKLSEERAKEVQSYLENRVNGEAISIETKGYGETQPISSNESEDGREKNRRVEIVVEPLQKKES